MHSKFIITPLLISAITLALTACASSSSDGSSSRSGSNEPASSVIRANTHNAQGNVTGFKVTTLNSAGNPTLETFYGNDGQTLTTIEYTYDGARLTGTIRRNARGDIIARSSISYTGTTRRSNRYSPDGTLLEFIITTINDAGQITQEETRDPNNITLVDTLYFYDSDGFRIEQRTYTGAGRDRKLTTYTRYRYHPDGTLRAEHTYNAGGLLVDYITYTYGRGTALSNPDDTDGDGISDSRDNCPALANPEQKNIVSPGNTIGDACDDTDNDGPYDATDNCPTTPNNDQADTDGDGTGDACDEQHTRPDDTATDEDISSLVYFLSIIGNDRNPINARLTAHIEITPEALRAYNPDITEWTPQQLYGVLDGNGYTFRGLNNQALFAIIDSNARVTNLGIIGGIMASQNDGTISNSYATGDSIGSGIRGGLVRLNNGIIRNSYALGNSASSGGNTAGGLIGSNNDDGIIIHSYATGTATHGGLTGNDGGDVVNSYAVDTITNTLGEQRTLAQLRCPRAPRDLLCLPHTYIGWNSSVWDFGSDSELPTLRGFAPCPRSAPNCRRYRAAGDNDTDGVANLIDNCPLTPNPHQYNNDSDRNGDACDTDDDNDGRLDTVDNCPTVPNDDQVNTDRLLEPPAGIGILGSTILGDACDDDDDEDGIPDYHANGTAYDNCRTIRNLDQANDDNDPNGNKCDDDDDNDLILDIRDNCPTIPNKDQANLDNQTEPTDGQLGIDILGDACDPDIDGDGDLNAADNCPTVANPDQTDTDRLRRTHLNLDPKLDGGDACDDDDDEDGIPDYHANGMVYDNCRLIVNPAQYNNDTDALGDACDTDDDNDGIDDSADTGANCRTIANARDPDAPSCHTIANYQDIITHLTDNAAGYYRLTDNITLSADTPWTPPTPFRGTLDGDNHTITFGNGMQPLFDRIEASATVTHIGIINSTLAYINRGIISYAYATGDSSCTGAGCTSGGLVGQNHGTLRLSYATGDSNCIGAGCNSGGLVGYNERTLNAAYATGNSVCAGAGCNSGGLVGNNADTITRSYATGNSSGRVSGGLVGLNFGTISNSYATGYNDGFSSGGLVGTDIGTIKVSYRVQNIRITNTHGFHRALAQLRCPTATDRTCEGNTTYSEWNATLWDFGTPSLLPTLRHLPPCPPDNPACRHRITDTDHDGVADAEDNCLTFANANQADRDGDDYGDACDAFPTNATEWADADGDRTGDNADAFPNDPTEQTDTDDDGTGDNADAFPNDPTEQTDTDGDGIGDRADNCHILANPTQANLDGDAAGDACDPLTLIASASALQAITNGIYRLTANLTVTGAWTPISDFRGTLNGNNHTITFGNGTQPLFDRINAIATVTQIGIINSTLAYTNQGNISYAYATGNSNGTLSGGLVGDNRGTITHSYATGNSSSCAGRLCRSGGLVGENRGTITHSYATGNSNGYSSGGLVGENLGTITHSYATGNSACAYHRYCNSGGLVGGNYGIITASYATGDSTCHSSSSSSRICDSGGLVGYNGDYRRWGDSRRGATITASYATGDSTCIINICHSGGLVGYNWGGSYGNIRGGATITASYATGNGIRVSNGMRVYHPYNGLAGRNFGIITASYRVQRSGFSGIYRTLAQLRCPTVPGQTCKSATTYSGWDDAIWDFGTANSLPTIRGLVPDSDSDGISDNRDNCPTESNPDQNNSDGDDYGDACDSDDDNDGIDDSVDAGVNCRTIANALDPDAPSCRDINTDRDLIDLLNGTISADGYYRLTDDITISAGAGWAPISDFRGTLNGNNHTITFTTPQPNQPLFDSINATATVTRIGIINSTLAHRNDGNISYAYATGDSTGSILSINGFLYTISGGLVDYNSGNITASYATGNSTCTGGNRFYNYCPSGGLVGENHGTLSASYATGNSTCYDDCTSGGLVGFNDGNITASYATGNSTCYGFRCYSGGLVGQNSGVITASYATGSSTCTDGDCSSGGLVGFNDGTITASYATGNSNGGSSGGLVGFNDGTITASYATGNSTCYDDCTSGGSGGLVGRNTGTITASYATGSSTCTDDDRYYCSSGGLVGANTGTITASYATGSSTCTDGDSYYCSSGGLVGENYFTIAASYRVQTRGSNTDGIHRTLAQLRCPIAPGEFCQDNNTYSEWNATLWDFRTPSLLPTLQNLPPCPTDNPACRHRILDTDNDSIADVEDNCLTIANANQADRDNDDYGDACDDLPDDATEHRDTDNDSTGDNSDNCPTIYNLNQDNDDGDDYGNACDAFPTNATEWADADGDGTGDNADAFPYDPDEQTDTDGDRIGDKADNCPTDYNPLQRNLDDDDIADACDPLTPIANATALQAITNGYYQLTTDIIAPTSWIPISDFRGTLNGNNHTITFHTSEQPVFYTIHYGASVTHIGILNSTLAYRNDGNISYAYATGNSAGYYYYYSGGLVGVNGGTISHSYATGNSAGYYSSGGLVGVNYRGTITASYATGNSTCTSYDCSSGGLVGFNDGNITASYATGNSTCTSYDCRSGGLVGFNDGNITHSYATGNSRCTFISCRSGGLVGSNHGTITASYRVQSSGTDGGDGDTPQTLAELRSATSYTGWSRSVWDFGTTAELPRHSASTGIPLCPGATSYSNTSCRWSTPAPDPDTDGDAIPDSTDSCPSDPNLDCQGIATDEDLIRLLNGTISADGYYRLTDNITISAGAGWAPISDFRGTLNGNNHTITFTTPQPNQPLFDYINATATVTHIGIINSTLAYINHGNISYAYATGNSICTDTKCRSGGLVGENHGILSNSYATGNSQCSGPNCRSGGLVAHNRGTITASYAIGSSSCSNSGPHDSYCGGLVGSNGGTITASYATGSCSSSGTHDSYCGGLVGYNYDTITASYATGTSSSHTSHANDDSISGGLVGLNIGNIIASYATENSICTGPACASGGLVGWNRGTISNSYANGHSDCSGHSCNKGGLVGKDDFGTLRGFSYRTQTSGTSVGTQRYRGELRCPTVPRDTQCPVTYTGWPTDIWDFGTSSELPRHHNRTGIPFCPGATSYSDLSCRW